MIFRSLFPLLSFSLFLFLYISLFLFILPPLVGYEVVPIREAMENDPDNQVVQLWANFYGVKVVE